MKNSNNVIAGRNTLTTLCNVDAHEAPSDRCFLFACIKLVTTIITKLKATSDLGVA